MSINRILHLSPDLWQALMAALYLLVRQSKKFTEVRWGSANR